jgi:hypothetical protein
MADASFIVNDWSTSWIESEIFANSNNDKHKNFFFTEIKNFKYVKKSSEESK